ncbi:peroxiredoxin-like family protein [Balneola sp. MJW-20]|uniref:peroxiredoxin-like family protein n=1 Tax=Gracilimonas aurantiaca TaxID=3234185 RepID=UPI0034654576
MYLKTLFLSLLFLVFINLNLSAQDYAETASEVTPLLIGSIIPDVSVKNIESEELNLRELVSSKQTVIIFYRGGWCPYCSQHLAELNEIEDEIRNMGYQFLAISADRPEELRKSKSKADLNYTLLSDSPMNATKAFGLAFKVDEATVQRYMEIGIDLEKSSGYDHHLLPVPAVYILDTDGKVLFDYVNPDYRQRINGEILLTAARVYRAES